MTEEAKHDHNDSESGTERGGTRNEDRPESNGGELQALEEVPAGHLNRPLDSSGEDDAGISEAAGLDEAIRHLPEENQEEIRQYISLHQSSSSPVPPPSFLGGYNQQMVDGAQQLMDLTKERQAAEIRQADAAIQDNHKTTNAETFALRNVAVSAAWFPWALAILSLTLILIGKDGIGIGGLAAAVGVGGLPRIVEALRGRPTRGPEES